MKYLGLIIIALGLAMFVIGIGAFTAQGKMSFILREFGEFSFNWWFQTIIIGLIFIVLSSLIGSKKKHHEQVKQI